MISLKVVTNTSPLIYLAILNRFQLLRELFDEVSLPEAVYHEVAVHESGQPGVAETRAAVEEGWLRRIAVRDRVAVDSLLGELHLGEAEAIVLARKLRTGRVLLDDRIARNKARLMGLMVTGTIGILLLAREAGIEVSLQQDLDRLIQHNFRISRELYNSLVRVDA